MKERFFTLILLPIGLSCILYGVFGENIWAFCGGFFLIIASRFLLEDQVHKNVEARLTKLEQAK